MRISISFRKIFFLFLLTAFLLAGFWFLYTKNGNILSEQDCQTLHGQSKSLLYTKEELFCILQKGTAVGAFEVGDTARLGGLQITLHEAGLGTYKSLELDANNQRIYKNYFSAGVRVYNTSYSATEEIIVGLEDDFGNQYIMDHSIASYLDGIEDFGWAKNVIPQTIREGHLLFPPIPDKAKKLKLTFMSEVSNEKIIFEVVP